MILFTWLCLSTPIKKAHCMHAVGGRGEEKAERCPYSFAPPDIHTRVSRKRQFDRKKDRKLGSNSIAFGGEKGGGKGGGRRNSRNSNLRFLIRPFPL